MQTQTRRKIYSPFGKRAKWAKLVNKKHLKNVVPIHHCEPLHAHSPGVATVVTVARRLRIDVHDNADANDDDDNDNNDNDNA